MTTAPVIAYSDFDKPFILYINALEEDVRAVLHQKGDDGREKLIAYASRALLKNILEEAEISCDQMDWLNSLKEKLI